MNYENLPCPACGSHMHEGDDIVVCPECATPQHRSCWEENGHCINLEKHSETYVWTPSEVKADGESEQKEPLSEMVICHICGSENLRDSTHCGRCGAYLNGTETDPVLCRMCGCVNAPNSQVCANCGSQLTVPPTFSSSPFTQLTGMDEKEKIGEHTAIELASYVRTFPVKYLHRFRRIEDEGKGGFNWAAFLLGYIWFFYRKIYKAGIILMVVLTAASMVLLSSAYKFFEVSDKIVLEYCEKNGIDYTINNNTDDQNYATDNPNYTNYFTAAVADTEIVEKYSSEMIRSFIPSGAALLIILITIIIFALNANALYYKKINNDFSFANNQVEDTEMRNAWLRRRGGVSILSAISSYFICTLISDGFTAIADMIAGKL